MRVGRHLPPFWGGPLTVTVRLLREHCHVCTVCNVGETVGWIRISLGTEVGLGSGDIVLDGGTSCPTARGTAAPNFQVTSIVSKRSPIAATAALVLQ